MKNFCLISLVIFVLCIPCTQAQVKTSFLIQSTLEDEWIVLSVDKVVYFAGDTVRLTIGRTDSVAKASSHCCKVMTASAKNFAAQLRYSKRP